MTEEGTEKMSDKRTKCLLKKNEWDLTMAIRKLVQISISDGDPGFRSDMFAQALQKKHSQKCNIKSSPIKAEYEEKSWQINSASQTTPFSNSNAKSFRIPSLNSERLSTQIAMHKTTNKRKPISEEK